MKYFFTYLLRSDGIFLNRRNGPRTECHSFNSDAWVHTTIYEDEMVITPKHALILQRDKFFHLSRFVC